MLFHRENVSTLRRLAPQLSQTSAGPGSLPRLCVRHRTVCSPAASRPPQGRAHAPCRDGALPQAQPRATRLGAGVGAHGGPATTRRCSVRSRAGGRRWPGAVTAAVGRPVRAAPATCWATRRALAAAPGGPGLAPACQPPDGRQRPAGFLAPARDACLRRCRLRVTAGLVQRRPGVPLRLCGAARHLCRVRGRNPRHPRGRARRVRWVALLALQPGRLPRAAGGAHSRVLPPAHPAPSPASPSSRTPHAACAGCGRRPRSRCPRGAPRRHKPPPGPAGSECSGGAGSFCQGYPRCARR